MLHQARCCQLAGVLHGPVCLAHPCTTQIVGFGSGGVRCSDAPYHLCNPSFCSFETQIVGFDSGAGKKFLLEGKPTAEFGGRPCVLEHALPGDVALVQAHRADRWGNLTYRRSGRNFNPVMAMAAKLTIAQVDLIEPLGTLDPEHVVTPGIFVQSVVEVANPAQEEILNREGAVYP